MRTHLVAQLVGMSKKTQSSAGPFPSTRLGTIRLWTFTLAALVMALAVPAAPAQDNQSSPAASAGTIHYAIGERVCQPAKPGHSTCFAIRRVEVTEGTPGALPYEPGAGARMSDAADGRDATTGPSATIGPHGGLTPSDLATAYGFSPTATGTGQTVAIVDAFNDPNINADLQTFDTKYGLPTCSIANGCFKVVNQNGALTPLPAKDTTGWTGEIALDVETVHSVCQTCKIILVEADSSSNADLAAAVNAAAALKATEISNSYGGAEDGDTSSSAQAAYNHPGIVIVASSGDDGYYDFDLLGGSTPSPYNQANTPSSLPTVVAVGGTSLYLGQTATRQYETVWNDNGTKDYDQELWGSKLGAAGGGCSNVFTAPGWQSNVSNWASTACGKHRLVSDVAADADYLSGMDVYNSYNCGSSCTVGWETIGGTSLAAPLISAMFGLAGGSHGIAYPALTLYGHLGSSSLYNVTVGGNGWCNGQGASTCGNPNTLGYGIVDCDYPGTGTTPSVGDAACDAGPGFNGPTGVGTPNGLGAFALTGPTAKIAGPTPIARGATNTWTATTTDPFPGGKVTGYSWNWGDGTAVTVTTTGSAQHAYAVSGVTETITLTVTDNYGVAGTAKYSVTVSPIITISPASGSLPDAYAGSSYSTTLKASAGNGIYTWSVASGSVLPSWLKLAPSTGVLSGTPTAAPASATFTLKVSDTAGNVATATYSLTVNPGITISPAGGALPGATVNTAYTTTLKASGGNGKYTWSVASGSTLPSWLKLTSSTNGLTLNGKPTAAAAAASFTLKVADTAGNSATGTYSVTVTN